MKRLFAILVVMCFLLCSCSSGANNTSSFTPPLKSPREDFRFVVNNKDISNTATVYVYNEYYAIIPLIAISKAFDAQVTWKNNKASIKVNGTEYILNALKNEMYKDGDKKSLNMLSPIPGANPNGDKYCKKTGDEYYVDIYSAESYLRELGVHEYNAIDIDYDDECVYINKHVDSREERYSLDFEYIILKKSADSNAKLTDLNEKYSAHWEENHKMYYKTLCDYFTETNQPEMLNKTKEMYDEWNITYTNNLSYYEDVLLLSYSSGSIVPVKLSDYKMKLNRSKAVEMYLQCRELGIEVESPENPDLFGKRTYS